MTMLSLPDLLPLALRPALAWAAVTLMVWAALEDLRARHVPNAVPLGLLVLFPLHLALASPAPAWLPTGFCALTLFAVLLFLWQRGLLGGGDVKLATVLALWLGADQLAIFLLATSLLGGVLALAVLLRSQGPGALGTLMPGGRRSVAAAEASVPYAVAIVGAGLPLLLPALA